MGMKNFAHSNYSYLICSQINVKMLQIYHIVSTASSMYVIKNKMYVIKNKTNNIKFSRVI